MVDRASNHELLDTNIIIIILAMTFLMLLIDHYAKVTVK